MPNVSGEREQTSNTSQESVEISSMLAFCKPATYVM